MNWEEYEKVMKVVRPSKEIKAEPLKKKKEAPYSNKDLFKKIIIALVYHSRGDKPPAK